MSGQESDRLRRQMAQVRRELATEVDDVVDQARELTDWRVFVRRHPWLCAGAAVAVGYLIVPQRNHNQQANSLASVATQHARALPKGGTRRKDIWGSLLSVAATSIVRALTDSAASQVHNLFVASPVNQHPSHVNPDQDDRPSFS